MTTAKISTSLLFYDNSRELPGLFKRYACVVLDECHLSTFYRENEVIANLQSYLESGTCKVARQDIQSTASFVMLGNIEIDNGLPKHTELFNDTMPSAWRHTAFLDRIHGILPGWELPKMREDAKAQGLGLQVGLIAQWLHLMRGKDVLQEVEQWLETASGANLRDVTAVKRLAAGFLKILFPHKAVTAGEFDSYCLQPAIRLRQKVRDELHRKSTEFTSSIAPITVRHDLLPDELLPVAAMERRIEVPAAEILTQGANASLSRLAPSITAFRLILEWDAPTPSIELDASVFLLGANGKVDSDSDFVFYNQPSSPCGSVCFDQKNGRVASCASFALDLRCVPSHVARLTVALTIFDGPQRSQHFGQVTRAVMRLLVAESGREVLRFELRESAGKEAAMLVGEFYRHASGWKIRALGQGFVNGLARLAENFGVKVD